MIALAWMEISHLVPLEPQSSRHYGQTANIHHTEADSHGTHLSGSDTQAIGGDLALPVRTERQRGWSRPRAGAAGAECAAVRIKRADVAAGGGIAARTDQVVVTGNAIMQYTKPDPVSRPYRAPYRAVSHVSHSKEAGALDGASAVLHSRREHPSGIWNRQEGED